MSFSSFADYGSAGRAGPPTGQAPWEVQNFPHGMKTKFSEWIHRLCYVGGLGRLRPAFNLAQRAGLGSYASVPVVNFISNLIM